jgi:hypothetical protein
MFNRKQPDLTECFLLLSLLFCVFLAAAQVKSDLRELDVLILADEEFESVLNWRERGKKALDQAAADFELLFGLGIKAKEFGSVQSNNSLSSMDDLAGDLEAKLKS